MTRATLSTDKGDIEIELFTEGAPKAAANFVDLARTGFYDDVVFHRVIPGFVAQAGDGQYGKKPSLDPSRAGTGGPGYNFEDEPVRGEYGRGAVAMANAGPNTNGSQFFICHQNLAGKLPKNYTYSARSPGGWTSSMRSSIRLGTRRICPTIPSRSTRSPSTRTEHETSPSCPSDTTLRNLHRAEHQNPWILAPEGVQ